MVFAFAAAAVTMGIAVALCRNGAAADARLVTVLAETPRCPRCSCFICDGFCRCR